MAPSSAKTPSKCVRLPYPNDEVAHQTIKRLQSLLIHDAEAEARLSELEAEADKYRHRRARLQEYIFRCRAVIAPVRRIPIAILAHIFGFIVAASPDAIAQVGAVCTSWREAARLPRFWTKIVITSEGTLPEQKVALYIRRSRHALLDVTYAQSIPHSVTLSYTAELPWKAWDVVRSAASRWKTLSLDFYDCKDACPRIRALGYAPCLEELRILIRRPCADPVDEGTFGLEPTVLHNGLDAFAENLPLLRNLHLETFVLPSTPGNVFNQLTKLHIRDTFFRLEQPNISPINAVNVLTLLAHCPSLEDFSFNAEGTYRWYVRAQEERSVNGPMIFLPHLRRLYFDCHYHVGQQIFEHLTTEALEFASLKLRPRHVLKDSGSTAPTIQFLNRTTKLRSLFVLGLDILPCSTRSFQHLEELHLQYCPYLGSLFDRFASEEPLTSPNSSWCAPRLSRLIVGADPFDIPDEKIATVVKVRFSANRRFGNPSTITRLVVNKRDMLKSAAPGEMAAFKRKRRFCRTPEKTPNRDGLSSSF